MTTLAVETPRHGKQQIKALIDSGAEAHFINLAWAEKFLGDVTGRSQRIEAIDGQTVRSHGQHVVRASLEDHKGESQNFLMPFEAVRVKGYDAIIGFPWLLAVNPDIHWNTGQWFYREPAREPEVRLITAQKAARAIERGNAAFIVYPEFLHTENETIRVAALASKDVTLPEELEEFADVFSEEEASILPSSSEYDHTIDLIPGKEPPYRPLHRQSLKEQEVLREYLQTALKKGYIRESKSPAGAPVLFVPKKDGTLRLCVDYRGLNAITVKNRYPLPLISETLDRLAGAKIFTQLDLRDAYHRIRIRQGDEWKTAFRTRYGHYEYLVMPFGLVNAPATFQSYINRALAGLLDTCCVAYLDDIVIYSNSVEEHKQHVRQVLERLRQWRLYCKLSKCAFSVDTISFLGYVISPEGISMEEDRVATIKDWPEPQSVKDIQSFIGFANFYRRFIQGFSAITKPLTDLTKGQEKKSFCMTPEARAAFQELKERFSSAPLLRHFDPELPIRLETDASVHAISAILSQKQQDDGQWHPVAFWSRKLKDEETRYDTGDGEMLAIVEAFKHFRPYLEGSKHPITVLTDHNNLRSFMSTKELTRRQMRWAERLAAFDFVIEHRPGSKNPADAPSRRADYVRDNAEQPLPWTLQDKLHRGLFRAIPSPAANENPVTVAAITASEPDGVKRNVGSEVRGKTTTSTAENASGVPGGPELLVPRSVVMEAAQAETAWSDMPEELGDLIRRCQQGDAFARSMIKELQENPHGTAERSTPYSYGNDQLLRYNGAVYIPPDPALKLELIRTNHDDPQGGHAGRKRTLDALRRKYYWRGMEDDVNYHVTTCQVCQGNMIHRHKPYGLLKPLPVPSEPFEVVSMDFITGLPTSKWENKSYDAILVIVCLLTKFAIYEPTRSDMDAEGLAKTLYRRLLDFTVPKHIVSDRGSLFTSAFWSAFCHYLAVRRRLSTAYHPQTDGQTERQNQTLECYLRNYVNYQQNDWARWIPLAQFSYNSTRHSVTGVAPAESLMGFRPTLRVDVDREPKIGKDRTAKSHAEEIKRQREILVKTLERAKEYQALQYDKKRQDMQFRIGDWVMLRNAHLPSERPTAKLDARQIGPFVIEDTWGKNAYKLRLPPRYRHIHPVFHVSLLEPYYTRAGRPPPPEPVIVDGEKEFVVKCILQDRVRRKRKEYLVHWKGYGHEEDTWEPEEHVAETQALDEYLKRKKTDTPANKPKARKKRRRGEKND